MPATQHRWTTAEVRALMDESCAWPRYELIDGALLVTPAPGSRHQIAVGDVFVSLASYVDRENVGITIMSPADLELEPGHITQPDVFVVPRGPRRLPGSPYDGWANIRSLLLAVEVISPSSVRTDREQKREYYLRVGVPEYWVVDVGARLVDRWRPGSESPTVLREMLGWHPKGAAEPLALDLTDLFRRIEEKYDALPPEWK